MRHYPWHPHPKLSATENVYGKENSPRQPCGCHPPQRGRLYSTHNLMFSAARHRSTDVVYLRNTHLWRLPVADREVFCGAFPQKAGFLPSFFTQKSGLTHIDNQPYSKRHILTHCTLQRKTIIARSGVYYATSLSRLFAFNIRNGNTIGNAY